MLTVAKAEFCYAEYRILYCYTECRFTDCRGATDIANKTNSSQRAVNNKQQVCELDKPPWLKNRKKDHWFALQPKRT